MKNTACLDVLSGLRVPRSRAPWCRLLLPLNEATIPRRLLDKLRTQMETRLISLRCPYQGHDPQASNRGKSSKGILRAYSVCCGQGQRSKEESRRENQSRKRVGRERRERRERANSLRRPPAKSSQYSA